MRLAAFLAIPLLAFMFMSAPALCADSSNPSINLPSGVKVEKSDDVTSQMLGRLFGESWSDVTGVPIESAGFYSGLIVKILGVLNLASLAFVATSILYMWGIMAVTTAHEGQKIGGSGFNSLWVPVRHAFSFSLTIPVLNGLSLLQVAMIACIGMSINFANVIWDAGGSFLSRKINLAVVDASSPMLETEALHALPYMFSDVVVQEIEKRQKPEGWAGQVELNDILSNSEGYTHLGKTYKYRLVLYGQEPIYLNEEDVEFVGGRNGWIRYRRPDGTWTNPDIAAKNIYGYEAINNNDNIDVKLAGKDDQYIVKTNVNSGIREILLRNPSSLTQLDMASIQLSYPRIDKDKNLSSGYSQAAARIADIKTEEIINLWEGMRDIARKYLESRECGSGDENCVIAVDGRCEASADLSSVTSVKDLIRTYQENVSSRIRPHVSKMAEASDLNEKLEHAIDASDSGSRHGWASAGLFSFTLASIQKEIDDLVLSRLSYHAPTTGAAKKLIDRAPKSYREDAGGNDDPDSSTRLDSTSISAMQKAPAFLSNRVLKGSRYVATDAASNAENDGQDLFERLTAKLASMLIFPSKSSSHVHEEIHGGILGQALDAFEMYDPIVVMQSFGNQLINIASGFVVGSFALAFFVKSFMFLGVIALLLMAGCVFAYVVPITPVIFWCRALMSWLFMVIEALVAAPFWACAHALPEGHGFAGQHARRGYMMLIDIVARPALLVIGAIFAIAVIQSLGWLFSILFNSWFSVASGFIEIGVLADISFTIVLMSFMYYMSFTIFTRGVNYLPEHVMEWCGGTAGGMKDEEGATKNILVAGGSFNTLSSQLTGAKGLGKMMPHLPGGKGSGSENPAISAGNAKA